VASRAHAATERLWPVGDRGFQLTSRFSSRTFFNSAWFCISIRMLSADVMQPLQAFNSNIRLFLEQRMSFASQMYLHARQSFNVMLAFCSLVFLPFFKQPGGLRHV
jgi:hypothetical protein